MGVGLGDFERDRERLLRRENERLRPPLWNLLELSDFVEALSDFVEDLSRSGGSADVTSISGKTAAMDFERGSAKCLDFGILTPFLAIAV